MKTNLGLFAAAGVLALATVSGDLEAAQRVRAGLPPSAALLLRHDANRDGIVSKEEVEAGLKADFEAADLDDDACLDPAEVRAENERRLARDGAQASPLVDWNLDHCVDAREFGNTVRSYFDLADRTRDGRVSQVELRGPSMPMAPPTAARPAGMNADGSTTQTPTNPYTGLPY